MGTTTLSITAFSIITISINSLYVTLSNTMHCHNAMWCHYAVSHFINYYAGHHCSESHYSESHYSESHNADCNYAVCCGAIDDHMIFVR